MSETLTVQELENSGYNDAAQLLLAGDQMGACLRVLNTRGCYDDDEDVRVRTKATRVMGQIGRDAAAEGLETALKLVEQQHTVNVHVVEVFDRDDGIYIFADLDDAIAFEAAVNGSSSEDDKRTGHDVMCEFIDGDLSIGSRCIRREEVVCDHADTLKLIASEKEE